MPVSPCLNTLTQKDEDDDRQRPEITLVDDSGCHCSLTRPAGNGGKDGREEKGLDVALLWRRITILKS